MDSELLALFDQLEVLLQEGRRVPLSSHVMILPGEAIRLLDQMRQTLPREIVRGRHIYQERERLLQEAQAEAEAIRVAARSEREALIAEHTITIEAIRVAEQVKREAHNESERLHMEADAYALHSLRDLQVQLAQYRGELDQTLKTVSGGIEMLEGRTHYTSEIDPFS